MDLKEHLTEIAVKNIFPPLFVRNVVRNVCSWQFADSEELRMKFVKFMDGRFLVDLAVAHLIALVVKNGYDDIESDNKINKLLLDVSLLIVGFMNSFDYGGPLLRIELNRMEAGQKKVCSSTECKNTDSGFR